MLIWVMYLKICTKYPPIRVTQSDNHCTVGQSAGTIRAAADRWPAFHHAANWYSNRPPLRNSVSVTRRRLDLMEISSFSFQIISLSLSFCASRVDACNLAYTTEPILTDKWHESKMNNLSAAASVKEAGAQFNVD